MAKLLTPEEAKAKLPPGWRVIKGKTPRLQARAKFGNFVQALRFVNHVGRLAEAQGHHPNITIKYNRVTLDLWTHSEGGITAKDLTLANAIVGLTSKATKRTSVDSAMA